VRRRERIEHFETERVSKDGRHVAISLSVSPVRDRHGEVVGASKIARDISERLRADAERARLVMSERAARERAESASRAKDEFVAMISHEMRSPLNAILGWAQMLREAPLDTLTAARALDSIDRNARAQVQLLDDLLDISRAITGKLRVAMRPVDLRQSLEAALESIRPATEAKSITIHVHDERHGSVVTGDADRLQQIFWNLLSNAVKFTPKHGHITVTMRQANSQVETTVSDSGIGIAADFLPHVFERFAQAETRTGKHGGLGLGLAIARQLVEVHGGTISAASGGEGQGTTFTVKLPVRAIREDAESREPTHAVETLVPPPDLEGVRVMVADDAGNA
jgi:signal transduction histidine kinase